MAGFWLWFFFIWVVFGTMDIRCCLAGQVAAYGRFFSFIYEYRHVMISFAQYKTAIDESGRNRSTVEICKALSGDMPSYLCGCA